MNELGRLETTSARIAEVRHEAVENADNKPNEVASSYIIPDFIELGVR